MLNFVLGLVAGVVLMIVLALRLRKKTGVGSNEEGGPVARGTPEVEIPRTPRRELYEIASGLQEFYQSTAHPVDLLEHPDFQRGVTMLSGARYSIEDVQAYVDGDNALLGCIALEALTHRDDGSQAIDRALDSLNTAVPWARYFALQVVRNSVPASASLTGPRLRPPHGRFMAPTGAGPAGASP